LRVSRLIPIIAFSILLLIPLGIPYSSAEQGTVLGEIKFDKGFYLLTETPSIQVMDIDENTDPNTKDTVMIDVRSDSDAGGIDLLLVETDIGSGVFEGILFLTGSGESSESTLRVSLGDTIIAEYDDESPPPPFDPNDSQEVTDAAKILSEVPEGLPTLSEKNIQNFEKMIQKWNTKANTLENIAERLKDKASTFDEKGQTFKAEHFSERGDNLLGQAFVLHKLAESLGFILDHFDDLIVSEFG